MRVHLIDGTYELFRHFYAVPARQNRFGEEIGAVRGVVVSLLGLLEGGATHVAVATDHVIESFRNRLWAGYKTGDGIDPVLFAQFAPLESSLRGLGFVVWAMVEHEADDALAAGARLAQADPRVEEVLLCTPDKDLAQCVVGDRVVMLDRRRNERRNQAGVIAKFGVAPASIPDVLALVGDQADGYPGLPGFGARSAALLLGRYHHLESIPEHDAEWPSEVRGSARLAQTFRAQRERALLFRRLATLDVEAPVARSVDELEWKGPSADAQLVLERLDAAELELPPARRAGA